jgi:sterol desaturase/sphingolipid hydroxylase (fatty acid hydroxylase superfamily)
MDTLSVPLYIALILVEMGVAKFLKRAKYETRDTVTSLLMGAGSVVAGIAFGWASYAVLMWFHELTPLRMGFSLPVLVLAFVLDDCRYYWWHRFAHTIRWMWASHVNHHSSQHYNLSTALRQPWTSTFSLGFLVRVPLVLLGFHPALLAFCAGLNLVYQFWIHTEAIDKMPRWFEAVFNTPSHHRGHHAANPRYLDCNYAGTLIVWDRLFGTFVPEVAHDPPRYGLVHQLGTFNPIRVALHEWAGIFRDQAQMGLSLKQRALYALGRPGYSHDGTRKDSRQLKADYVAQNPDQAGMPGLPALPPQITPPTTPTTPD